MTNYKPAFYFLFLFLALCLSSCTYLSFRYANIPATFSDQLVISDVDFGSNYNSRLDIYKPKKEINETLPVIVFFYGGSWKTGNKEDYSFVAESFTSRGYIVVIPDYVKYPEVKYPLWQEDAAKATTWVENNIHTYGGSPDELFIAGHSSGAHIGAMLVADESFLKNAGGLSSNIKAFAGLCGPYDFIPLKPDFVDMFGPKEKYYRMQVTHYVDSDQAPMMLLWGKEDTVVFYSNIEKLKKGLDLHGASYQIRLYENLDHTDIVAVLSALLKNKAPVISDIDSFFKSTIANVN